MHDWSESVNHGDFIILALYGIYGIIMVLRSSWDAVWSKSEFFFCQCQFQAVKSPKLKFSAILKKEDLSESLGTTDMVSIGQSYNAGMVAGQG